METAICVKNLCKSYGDFKLENINLSLPKGTILGFIGENGAGKSTTIKCMLDLIQKDCGEITFFHESLEKNPKKVKEDIGVVFDDCYFHDTLNLKQINQMMKYAYSQWDEKQFYTYALKFDLPIKKALKTYSRGMRMKLSLAVALSHHAKLLILDEPTSGLDPVIRSEILDVFLEFIQDEEHAIMLSTHITSDLDKIADYICFIHNGKILFTSEKDRLLENYAKVKGDLKLLEELNQNAFIYIEKSAFSFEGMIDDVASWKQHYPNLTYEKPTLEEIMIYHTKGERTSCTDFY